MILVLAVNDVFWDNQDSAQFNVLLEYEAFVVHMNSCTGRNNCTEWCISATA